MLEDLNKGILLCTGCKVFTRLPVFRVLNRHISILYSQNYSDRFLNYFSYNQLTESYRLVPFFESASDMYVRY
jgi:hypothetical protein